jgi:amino acid transporter, AAT family
MSPFNRQSASSHGQPEAPFTALEREHGLVRELSVRQLVMMALGAAIGTGLFLGSSLAVRQAGPAVVLTFLLGGVITLAMLAALSEMAAAHPAAGSFGIYADLYLTPWAGFAVRYTYWIVCSIAIGSEAAAVAVYGRWWFSGIPAWLWVVGCAVLLIYVNAREVGTLGEFEYWFSLIKVIAIALFIVFGMAELAGLGRSAPAGLRNFTAQGGFFPHGVLGAWKALAFVIFGYIGTEVVAVGAGEARDPSRSVPKALRATVSGLIALYLGAMIVLIALVPWNQIQPGRDVTASPFVTVFQSMGVPGAASLVNFIVLTAALSSMNCNLYVTTRMMFSLARAGYAPAAFGRLSPRGTPLPALWVSAFGLALATVVAIFTPGTAYVVLFGTALFGGLFVWIVILVTHFFFRKAWARQEAAGGPGLPVRVRGYPYLSIVGLTLLVTITATTWWVEGMRITLLAGIPWLGFISLAYWAWRRRQNPQ